MDTEIEKILPQDDPENMACHDICMGLFRKFKAEEIILSEFHKELAYAALRYGFEELRPRMFPHKPQDLVDYEKLTFKERANIKSDFWLKFEIVNYLDTVQDVRHWNKATMRWLKELLGYLPKEDYPSISKIKNRLVDF